MFRVELDETGWRVIDGCLDFGPYDSADEAESIAKQLNLLDWKAGAKCCSLEAGSLDDLLDGRSIN